MLFIIVNQKLYLVKQQFEMTYLFDDFDSGRIHQYIHITEFIYQLKIIGSM